MRELFARDGERAARAAKGCEISLMLVAPDACERLTLTPLLESALAGSREGNQPGWTSRVAHGVVDFVAAWVAGRAKALAIGLIGRSAADPLDRTFFTLLEQRLGAAVTLVDAEAAGREPPRHSLASFFAAGVTGAALAAAADHCIAQAWYEAARYHGRLALAEPGLDKAAFRTAARAMLFADLMLGAFDAVVTLSTEWLASSDDPALRAHLHYAQAILAARLLPPAQRDLTAARRHVDAAIDETERLPPSEMRATNLAFMRNTMALIEMREGHGEAARALLDDALALLAREAPLSYPRESAILYQNRARLHVRDGRDEAARADLSEWLRHDPGNAEAHFDRALIDHRHGRFEPALDGYDQAIMFAPPDVPTLLNRARCLTALGRNGLAVSAYARLLDIDPGNVDGRCERALLLLDQDPALAEADIAHGLEREPGNARLLCLHGMALMQRQETGGSRAAFDAAIARDPALADAWANRARLHYRQGDYHAALADLERAAMLSDDPTIARNLAKVRSRLLV